MKNFNLDLNGAKYMVKQGISLMLIATVFAITLASNTFVAGQNKSANNTVIVRADQQNESPKVDFAALSRDLELMDSLFKGGGTEPVTFDSKAAFSQGFSKQSIELAEEMAALTNDLILAASTAARKKTVVDVTKLDVDDHKYPLVEAYLAHATELAKEASGVNTQLSKEEYMSNHSLLCITPQCVCGSYAHPRPERAVNSRFFKVINPAATLRSWGFHETPRTFHGIPTGGGWTRPQTYKPFLCGWATFRDHGTIRTDLHYFNLSVQDYRDVTPHGEPNPEFWRSGPWPYLTWPIYVRWWHATH